MRAVRDIGIAQYRALADLRFELRRFLSFSETAARAAGLQPQQHQLLLVLKALRPEERPTVRVVALRLQIKHNSAVELVRRCVARGLVRQTRREEDRRETALRLTAVGERVLRRLSLAHREELRSAAPRLVEAFDALLARAGAKETHPSQRSRVRAREHIDGT